MFQLILADLVLAYIDLYELGLDFYNEASSIVSKYIEENGDEIIDTMINNGLEEAKKIIVESFIAELGHDVNLLRS